MSVYEKNLKQVLKYMNIFFVLHIPIFYYMSSFFGTERYIALGAPIILILGNLFVEYIFKNLKLASALMGFSAISMSAIMIHLGKGMIEWHFHIFVMIGILSLFANPMTIITAALVAAIHHISFYFFLPESVFNYDATFGIVLIHAAFVVVESCACFMLSLRFKNSLSLQEKLSIEISPLVKSIDEISKNTKLTCTNLLDYTNSNSSSITEISATAEEITQMVKSTLDQIGQCVSLMKETNDSVDSSSEAIAKGEEFLGTLKVIKEKMTDLGEQSSQKLGSVEKSVNDISDKTTLINDIVFQTKLLSFNASVEAARAGESGKGFAVVAEEIGNLAETSGKASEEIGKIVEQSKDQLNLSIEDISESIKSFQNQVGEAFNLWAEINDQLQSSFSKVRENSLKQEGSLDEISAAANQQTTGVSELSEALATIDDSSNDSLAKLKELEMMTQYLEENANKLSSLNNEMKN